MKELSIEQKAKRYDEAIKEAVIAHKDEDKHLKATLERIFPELKESEDERIRKELINIVAKSPITFAFEDKNKVLSWLERQGEHANFINKIQIGDKVTRNEDGVLVNLSQLNRVAKKDEKQDQNNMGISEATKQKLEDNLNNALEKETPESWNKFLDEQGEQQSSTWSKEDERMIDTIIYDLERHGGKEDSCYSAEITWLKSLKERYTWRPSDKQITWLYRAADDASKDSRMKQILNELLSDLKKLREG